MLATEITSNEECRTLSISKLDPRISEKMLQDIFVLFAPVLQVKINRESARGYHGFIEFYEHLAAEQALHAMDGRTMFGQQIQVTWATKPCFTSTEADKQKDIILANLSYEEIFAKTSPHITTVHISNLPYETSRQDVAPYFQQYGYVSDIYIPADRGYAFVKLDTHANAAMAIFALQGFDIRGRPVKLSWADETHQTHSNDSDPILPFGKYMFGSNRAQILPESGLYDMYATRPPAPVAGALRKASGVLAGNGGHGWNQYYLSYYSGGYQCT
ncbi:hypothetical protein DFQ28_004899 [Apophysomyces sp. BC1034]|nr:hypothetical protein DFQ30_004835 [Apophysomyces sp. BC1015]KAG0178165.1 hypothetical protein DFQ29_003842 [Apophysomyces sp. BC1021]KAG0188411.1 hypothetical protein DFQ28_004899 [Apophysomyces sp. BC1034]